jgi:two-component system, NtrC family, sensor kinase
MSSEVLTSVGDQFVEALRRELAEAREQQAATAGILAAISNSPTDAYGVFTEIAARAARLCGASNAGIFQLADGSMRLIARHGSLPGVDSIGGAVPLIRGSLVGRAVIDRKTIHVADLQALTEEYPEGSAVARQLGHRTIAAIPLIRAGQAIGVITVRRAEARLFSERHIELLKTFADQAVICLRRCRRARGN